MILEKEVEARRGCHVPEANPRLSSRRPRSASGQSATRRRTKDTSEKTTAVRAKHEDRRSSLRAGMRNGGSLILAWGHGVYVGRQRMRAETHLHERFCVGQARGLKTVGGLVLFHRFPRQGVPPPGRGFMEVTRLDESFLDLLSALRADLGLGGSPRTPHGRAVTAVTVASGIEPASSPLEAQPPAESMVFAAEP